MGVGGVVGNCRSLVLDSAGRAGTSYFDVSKADLTFAWLRPAR